MLLAHIRIAHSNDAGFSIQCNLQGCQRTFKRFTTYRNHIYNFHDTSEVHEDAVPSMDPDPATSDSDDDDDTNNTTEISGEITVQQHC